MGGVVYAVVSVILGVAFLYLAARVWRSDAGDAGAAPASLKKAKGLFGFSILYLFLLFAALIAEHGFGAYIAVPGLA